MPLKHDVLLSNHPACWLLLITLILNSCGESREKKQERLYATYCSSCHMAPQIHELPANIWEQQILPEMAARLGIREEGFDPYEGLSMNEQYQVIQAGVFPSSPMIKPEDWALLKDYILTLAPESLQPVNRREDLAPLKQFDPRPVTLDSTRGSTISFMELKGGDTLYTGDISGGLWSYNLASGTRRSLGRFGRGITAYTSKNSTGYVTSVGYLDPSEIASGRVFIRKPDGITVLPQLLHRPVHTTVHDFNADGVDELLISEYGDLKGTLSLLVRAGEGKYEKQVLLEQAGTIRTLARDMDNDGRDDILVLTAQGDEGVAILYQRQPLQFEAKRVLRFSPVYGTSWFETLDYEGDGDLDLITVHGDNADKSYVHKPYHGLRIHINEGDNQFREAYFYPLPGATRVVARDFDQDGDPDFGVLSTFPDYSAKQILTFVYLENKDAASYQFTPSTLGAVDLGRWFLMDAGDVDSDGDDDLVLSSFTYYFSPVPEDLSKKWENNYTDILILENTLYQPNE